MKKVRIEIEDKAGFCPGVVRAIELAEKELEKRKKLYCLGDIVHNPAEVERLKGMGLEVITAETYKQLRDASVLLRSHGEPPETFEIARKNNIELIDATCNIVGNLQKKVRAACKALKQKNGQVLIFGKEGHPETIGLKGVADGEAFVISDPGDLEMIDFNRAVRLFSQTTMDALAYQEIVEECSRRALQHKTDFEYQASTCGWMSSRVRNLRMFSIRNELIIFVAGEDSSNGKYLFGEVKKSNTRSHKISRVEELNEEWFGNELAVGISGATSTPRWQLMDVKERIESFYVPE
ncbi:MAG: 4-hydroxy-3-methylbut-2-enyl diphosphate reductase [Bacteroidota bacterium]|nr:4-hydroxy-3-methylbut-2-enyl diphosphate reductase [Bacteroidota bacterium]